MRPCLPRAIAAALLAVVAVVALTMTAAPRTESGRIVERVRTATRAGRWSRVRIEERLALGADGAERLVERRSMIADHVLVAFADDAGEAEVARIAAAHGATVRGRVPGGPDWLLAFAADDDAAMPRLLAGLAREPRVVSAEPDFLMEATGTPDDAAFARCWHLANTGQTGGTPGADIHASGAWSLCTGSNAVRIAVIDTGVDLGHPDLQGNLWTNPGETGTDAQGRDKRSNGVDDDGDGYVDDWRGWDFANHDNDPRDDQGHGTWCAGLAGARGDNALGVAGVCWRVSIIPLKYLSSSLDGTVSDAIAALDYARRMGCRAVSCSWGGPKSAAMQAAIAAAGRGGVLVCCAAGNAGRDDDATPFYPACYPEPNVIAVASSDASDHRASFSSWGATSIDLATPGAAVYSTARGGGYGLGNGTSAGAPMVAGACALLASWQPSLDAAAIKARLLATVDPLPDFAGRTVSGGRLDLGRLLAGAGSRLRLDVDDRLAGLWVDGVARALGPHAADYRTQDVYDLPARVGCIAVAAANGQPRPGWAGLIAKLESADGSSRVSDRAWRTWGGAGAPPNDAAGRPWWHPAYDDRAWPAATEAGGFGVAPWGALPGLAGLAGARWIWRGDAAAGVSPVYLRWDLAPPPAGAVVHLDVDDAYTELFVDGAAVPIGPHAADYTAADAIPVAGGVDVLAIRAVNAAPGTSWGGLIARVVRADGSAVVTDAAWRVHVGAPAADAAGRPWYHPDYDDAAWPAATVRGVYGVPPWGTRPGLAALAGASWIWAGDASRAVSPVYFRRSLVPAARGVAAR